MPNNVFEVKPEPDYVYQQYRSDATIEGFFKTIDSLIEEWYYGDTLEQMWKCRDIAESNSVYMYFYARYYLGLIRPVRIDPTDYTTEFPAANIINEYDTAVFFDNRQIWDDLGINDPEIPIALFIVMLKFVYNYGEPTWTYDLMIRYAAKMCNIRENDIEISFEPDKVIFWLVNSAVARSFIDYTAQDEYKLNLPFANCYEFRVGTHRKNTDYIDEFMLGYDRPDTWPVYPFTNAQPTQPTQPTKNPLPTNQEISNMTSDELSNGYFMYVAHIRRIISNNKWLPPELDYREWLDYVNHPKVREVIGWQKSDVQRKLNKRNVYPYYS